MIIVDGKKAGQETIASLKNREAPKKFLAVFACEKTDPATAGFLARKRSVAQELGVDFRVYSLEECKGNDDARRMIIKISGKKRCGGAILQLPLLERFDAKYLANAIPVSKDIDVLSEKSAGGVYAERAPWLPPAVKTVLRILKLHGKEISSFKSIAVIGQGFLIGKPIATYLSGKAQEVCILDKGADLRHAHTAELVISGVGVPELLDSSCIKQDAVVIDFGYAGSPPQGDVAQEIFEKKIPALITPTPGGTGPMLVAELFENFYTACSGQ